MPKIYAQFGRFAVMVSSAKMPASCRRQYRKVAVAEMENVVNPHVIKMVSGRAKGVRAILWESGPVSVGKTEKSACARAIAEAREIAQQASESEEVLAEG